MTPEQKWITITRQFVLTKFHIRQINNGILLQRVYNARVEEGVSACERMMALRGETTDKIINDNWRGCQDVIAGFIIELDRTPFWKFRKVKYLKYKINQFQDMAFTALTILETYRSCEPRMI